MNGFFFYLGLIVFFIFVALAGATAAFAIGIYIGDKYFSKDADSRDYEQDTH